MTWPAARAALKAALEAIPAIDAAFVTPPSSGAALSVGTLALIEPPGRRSTRTPGGRTVTDYAVRIVVARALVSDPETVAVAVDDAVDAIDAAMETHITLGGAVTSTDAITWSEVAERQYPDGSGQHFLAAVGVMPIKIIRTYERSA